MNAQELRVAMLDLLAEVRSVGRRAAGSDYEGILGRRLPSLAAATDAYGDVRMSGAFRSRLNAAVADACGKARERIAVPDRNGHIGEIRRVLRRQQTRWSWKLGLVGAAAVVLLGMLLYVVWAPRDRYVAPRDRPGVTGPESPRPPTLPLKPRGSLAEKGPETRIETRPIQGPRRRERLDVASVGPKVGRFGRVMGEPTVVAADAGRRTAAPGMSVSLGSVIETGDMDKAEIVFDDGSTLALDFNTTVEIPQSSIVNRQSSILRPSAIRVPIGRIWAKVEHRENEHFLAVTPVATAEVLGTEFGLAVEKGRFDPVEGGQGESVIATLQVKTGRVAFYNDFGRELAVGMTESVAQEGTAPTKPKRLRSLKVFKGRGEHRVNSETYRLSERIAVEKLAGNFGRIDYFVRRLPSGSVRIVYLESGTPAFGAGARAGDEIVAVDGLEINDEKSAYRALYRRAGQRVTLRLRRAGEKVDCSFTVFAVTGQQFGLQGPPADRLLDASLRALTTEGSVRLDELQALLRLFDHPAVHNNLGVGLELMDEIGEAIRSYQRAVRAGPTVPLYRVNLALSLRKIGNFARSREELEIALKLDPSSPETRAELVEACLLLDDFEDARREAEGLTSLFPDRSDSWFVRANCLMLTGNPEEGLDAARKGLELNPMNGQLWGLQGDILHDLKRIDQAEASFRKAISIDPGSPVHYRNLSVVQFERNRLKDAEAAIRKALELSPKWAMAYDSLANILRGLNRHSEAEDAARRAIQLDPTSSRFFGTLGLILSSTSRLHAAEEASRIAIRLEPGSANAHLSLGTVLMQRNRLADSEAAFRKAVELEPDWALAHSWLATVLLDLGRLDEAAAALKRAIELNPRQPWDHHNLGEILTALKRPEEAAASFRRVIELGSPIPDTHFGLAIALLNLKRFAEAEEPLRNTLQMAPNHVEANYRLGVLLYRQLGRPNEGLPFLRKAVELEPKNTRSLTSLVWALVQLEQDLNEALQLARRAAELAPRDMNVLSNVGWVLFKLGDFAGAEVHLAGSLIGTTFGQEKRAAETWWALGMVYEKTGRKEKAIETQRRALALDPQLEKSRDALNRLGG